MRCAMWGCALVALVAAASAAWAQSSDEAEQLRRQIQSLEEKLQTIQQQADEKARVTQLGDSRSRLREEEPVMVVRVYDLSDLFTMAPPYPAVQATDLGGTASPLFLRPQGEEVTGAMGMGGMGGMGGGMFNVKEGPAKVAAPAQTSLAQQSAGTMNSQRTSLDDLIDAITSTISPTEWDNVGGQGSIAPLGNVLLISASEKTHEQIENLFGTFRKRWGTLRTISLEAHWLWITETQLAALLAPEGRPAKPDEPVPFGLVSDAAWKTLQDQLQKPGQDTRTGYHVMLTCYNGQTVSAVSGGESLIVTGMIPVVGGGEGMESGIGYQPVTTTLQDGAALEVTPMATVAGKLIVLDVHSRVVEIRSGAREGEPEVNFSEVAELAAVIDRPQLVQHRLSTTLRVPVGRRVLVGGMTFESKPQAGQPNLYLFTKVDMQELRDDQPEAKPAVPPTPQPKK